MGTANHQAQKAIFGIRVPNSIPLASPASVVKVAREVESQGFHWEMTLEEIEEVSFVGSPEEVNEKVKAYIMSGELHFEIKFIYRTIDRLLEMMRLFSRVVLPNFT